MAMFWNKKWMTNDDICPMREMWTRQQQQPKKTNCCLNDGNIYGMCSPFACLYTWWQVNPICDIDCHHHHHHQTKMLHHIRQYVQKTFINNENESIILRWMLGNVHHIVNGKGENNNNNNYMNWKSILWNNNRNWKL